MHADCTTTAEPSPRRTRAAAPRMRTKRLAEVYGSTETAKRVAARVRDYRVRYGVRGAAGAEMDRALREAAEQRVLLDDARKRMLAGAAESVVGLTRLAELLDAAERRVRGLVAERRRIATPIWRSGSTVAVESDDAPPPAVPASDSGKPVDAPADEGLPMTAARLRALLGPLGPLPEPAEPAPPPRVEPEPEPPAEPDPDADDHEPGTVLAVEAGRAELIFQGTLPCGRRKWSIARPGGPPLEYGFGLAWARRRAAELCGRRVL